MTELTGRVLYPGDPGWDIARHGFAAWGDYDNHVPKAIVFCQDAHDVANAILWARENHTPIRARSGRHSYEGYSSLVKDGVIVDVSEMNSVRVSSSAETAEIGSGTDMIELYEALGASGMTLPAATGPTVGIAGLTLGGGFGVTTRKWGLTCDNLVEVELVNAHGKIIRANAKEHSDLFWALRGGGGGNFGIVTSFKFRVHKIANVAVFTLSWGWGDFEAVVRTWQSWAPGAEDDLVGTLMATADGTIRLYGQYTASDMELPRISSLLAPMLQAASPLSVDIQILPNLLANRVTLGLDPTKPAWRVLTHSDDQIFKSTSAFAFEEFPDEAIRILQYALENAPALSCSPSQPSMIQLLPGGGYPSRIESDATAVWARQAKFIVQYDAYWTAPQDGLKTIQWIEDLRTAMESGKYTRGAYVNYVDDKIPDWAEQYYGPNLLRLQKVKHKYDPENFFNAPQSIPT